jgi:hypothetical protein
MKVHNLRRNTAARKTSDDTHLKLDVRPRLTRPTFDVFDADPTHFAAARVYTGRKEGDVMAAARLGLR